MSPLLRIQGEIGQHTLLLATAAVSLTGWTAHTVNGRRAGRPGTAA